MSNNWVNTKLSYHLPEWIRSSSIIDPGVPGRPPEYRQIVPRSCPDAPYDLGSSAQTWSNFWHPVATLQEFRSYSHTGRGPMSTRLLDRAIVLVELEGRIRALDDRCPHRGASLGLGWIDKDKLRCRYHGWCYNPTGQCTEIPSLDAGKSVPQRIHVEAFDCDVKYDLIWVRLKSGANTQIPRFPAWSDPNMVCHMGAPYLWPASSGRRVANFIDVTHLPFGHQGTLGGAPFTRFKTFPIEQRDGLLAFVQEQHIAYNPGEATFGLPKGPDSVLLPPGGYEIVMPYTVILYFDWGNGRQTQLFMHPSPIDAENCRSYWLTCHTPDESIPQEHLALQGVVLTEDMPVVASHNPRSIQTGGHEFSVAADRVEMTWRRWLEKIIAATAKGPSEIDACLLETGTY